MKKAIIIALGIITLAGQISFFAPLQAQADDDYDGPPVGTVDIPMCIFGM